jgi:hypothetical protein
MATVIKNYSDLQQYIDSILTANGESPVGNPHQQFWDTLNYNQFITGNVPNVADPTSGQPMKILVVGNSKASNLILALQGAAGTVFDPGTGTFGQMPANGPPFFTAEQIAPIAAWIDAGCPNP